MDLPKNVEPFTNQQMMTFPYEAGFFHHIRAASLPTLVVNTQIPELLKECHRVLAPGGLLELRLIDYTPRRRTTGPLLSAWLDSLSMGITSAFRCPQPTEVMQVWVRNASFQIHKPAGSSVTQYVTLPAVYQEGDTGAEMLCRVLRAIWAESWGEYVNRRYDGRKMFWWDDEDILEECFEYNTAWDLSTLVAEKMD